MTHIVGTLILSPAGRIGACDAGAARIFGCAPSALLDRSVTAVLPDLPLTEKYPSENIRFANQYGGIVLWQPLRALAANGGEIGVELILSRCGYRPAAALWLTIRRPRTPLDRTQRLLPSQAAQYHPALAQPLDRDAPLAA